MDWQLAAVVVIEALALGYLASKLWPRRPRALTKPDVKVGDLVRKKRR
jgi:hypothetical protein